MTEQIEVINDKQITLHLTRKVAVRQFESLEVGVFLPVERPEGDFESPEYIDALHKVVRDGFYHLKVLAFDQLGLEYEDKNGVIAEKVATMVGGTVERVGGGRAIPPESRPKGQGPTQGSSDPKGDGRAIAQPSTPPPSPATSNGASAHPIFGNCKSCGGNQFWDNRDKKASGQYKSTAADGKCKNDACKKSVWLTRK